MDAHRDAVAVRRGRAMKCISPHGAMGSEPGLARQWNQQMAADGWRSAAGQQSCTKACLEAHCATIQGDD